MEDILNATLAGGVAIGAPAGIITNPAASLAIGLIVGSVSTIGFVKLTPKLQEFLGLNDTCGINNLHGIPGLLGGIFSAIVIAAYNTSIIDKQYEAYLPFNQTASGRTYSQQAGYQIAGTGASLGMGLLFGFIAGMVIACVYKFQEKQFFTDRVYF
ncbi:UNVERIFIED_CONTAM: hypothetical protein GTU68_046288 [Idotea baltica]|nr:hypothetical protein [Idotea baltica]